MKIASSDLAMSADHSQEMLDLDYQYLRIWNGGTELTVSQGDISAVQARAVNDTVEISAQAQNLFTAQLRETGAARQLSDSWPATKGELKFRLLELFVAAVTGKRISLNMLDYQQHKVVKIQPTVVKDGGITLTNFNRPVILLSSGRGLEYHSYKLHSESETTSFTAQGIVKTADGREINLQLALMMSRSFVSQNQIDIQAGSALRDPLVINYGGPAASLTVRRIRFRRLNQGSGFLALDKNGDGRINDGGELFGTKSGDGFKDLAGYDVDHNGWIDENDPIYNKLRIWSKDEQGHDQLLALGQVGIGAICLSNAASEFSLKDSNNKLDGQIRASGIFLREDGTAGTVQQVDIAV